MTFYILCIKRLAFKTTHYEHQIQFARKQNDQEACYRSCLNALLLAWNLLPRGPIQKDKWPSGFPIQLPFQISEMCWEQWKVTILGRNSLMTRECWVPNGWSAHNDCFNKKKSSECVHIECKQKVIKLLWLKWFSMAQNQITTKDLLKMFLRDRLHISTAFYISGNTFKIKPNHE